MSVFRDSGHLGAISLACVIHRTKSKPRESHYDRFTRNDRTNGFQEGQNMCKIAQVADGSLLVLGITERYRVPLEAVGTV